MANNFDDIAKQFVDFYYATFDQNRQNLASLYRDTSMLSFETADVLGAANIVEKLTSLPFTKIEHKVDKMKAQPVSNAILVLVTGHLKMDEEARAQGFSQTFQLMQDGGNWFIFNDIFTLTYPSE